MPMLVTGLGGPSETAWTWNPSDKDASVTLSNSNRTATFGSNSPTRRTVRAAKAIRGKRFFVLHAGNATGAYLGVANGGANLATELGGSTDSIGRSTTIIKYGNSNIVTGLPNLANGDMIMFAVDANGGRVWIGDAITGTWYDGGDPAAGIGENATLTGTLYPAASGDDSGPSVVNCVSILPPRGFQRL